MTAQNKAHRIIDNISTREIVVYNADHDIGVDYAWIDKQLFDLCALQQEQIEELSARLYVLEKHSA